MRLEIGMFIWIIMSVRKMRYSSVRKIDITNGPGVRVSLFTQGCAIRCEGCFNSEIWDYEGGKEWTSEVKKKVIEMCAKPQISGLSILGGEPLSQQNFDALIDLCESFKERCPHKSIWLWTGYCFEDLNASQLAMLKYIDVLIDGPWIAELGDFSLKYRGSSNQRILDAQKSIEQGKPVLYS